jgi:tetratricopeptide (TPR) repeat protein
MPWIKLIISTAVIVFGFAAVVALSGFTASHRVTMPVGYEDSDLAFRGQDLKGWALGAEGLLADWYWMWSLQHIGGKLLRSTDDEINLDDLRPLNPRLLHPLLDNAAELDPEFMAVYSYGASVLPAIDQELAIDLVRKGIDRNPEAWRLYQYLGYIYWRMKQYEKAAEVYERGSRIAGAPAFMRQMVAAMNTQGGSRDTARGIYAQMLAEAEDQQSRNIAELRLMELDALDEIDAINALLRSARESNGRCSSGLAEIFPRLRSVKLPHNNEFSVDAANNLVDPAGVPYVLDRETCTVSIAPESKVPKSL